MATPPPADATTPQPVDETTPAPSGTAADVKSVPPDSVVGEYKIDFAAMDTNGDGRISRAEARSNQTLTDEFRAVDNDHDGRLSKEELAGWM